MTIQKIREYIKDSKNVFKLVMPIVGMESNFNRVLLKYPDVMDILIDYMGNPDIIKFKLIEEDFFKIIIFPLIGLTEALSQHLKIRNFNDKLIEISNIKDINSAKKEILAILEEIVIILQNNKDPLASLIKLGDFHEEN